jgi:transporter family protein
MWVPLILASATALGLYDVAKKQSVRENAVMPVLCLATAFGSAVFMAAILASGRGREVMTLSGASFGLIGLKALLVSGSWILAYYAMRAMPLSIMSPIRASAPLWTLIGAVFLFDERPSALQGVGMALVLAGYGLFSILGKKEGIHFARHRGVFMAFGATLLGAASALYDKYLLQTCRMPRDTLQFWFCAGLVVVLGGAWFAQRAASLNRTPFQWRWSIPAVGLLLVAADWLYFKALSEPGVSIAVVSLIRRSNVILTFILGAFLFREENIRSKGFALLAILAGVAVLCMAR